MAFLGALILLICSGCEATEGMKEVVDFQRDLKSVFRVAQDF